MKAQFFCMRVLKCSTQIALFALFGCGSPDVHSDLFDFPQSVTVKINLPGSPQAECNVREQTIEVKFRDKASNEEFKLAIWAATLAYFPEAKVIEQAKKSGFNQVHFVDMSKVNGPLHSGFQAFIASKNGLRLVGIRGSSEELDWTEANFKDALVTGNKFNLPGNVHSGFTSQLQSGWDEVVRALGSGNDPIFLTGHSLGGALTTLFAGRLQNKGYPVVRAISFAAPKSGDDVYAKSLAQKLGTKLIRAVKSDDLIPQTPASAEFASIVAQIDKLGQSQEEIDKRVTFLKMSKYTHAGSYFTLNNLERKFTPSKEPNVELTKFWLASVLDKKKRAKSKSEEEFKKVNAELNAPHGIARYACPILGNGR